jgi:hypothetical protein
LESHPEIADSPNEEFKEFTEWMLYWGDFANKIRFEQVKVIIGQQILYHTMLMLVLITEQG